MTDKALPDNVADLARILVLVKATELDTCEEIAEALWPHLAPAPTLQESPGDERVVAIRFRVMQEHDDVTPLEYLRARYNHARDDRAYLLSLFPMHHKQNATDAASETNDASPSPTPAPTKAEVRESVAEWLCDEFARGILCWEIAEPHERVKWLEKADDVVALLRDKGAVR